MAKIMKLWAVVAAIGTVAIAGLYAKTSMGILLSLAIMFGTVAYHLIMRLLVGFGFDVAMKNRADISKSWYQVSPREVAFYNKIKIKKWKSKMPTYDESIFNPKQHSWDEIVQAMCQAELTHETIAVLSFLPIIAGRWFGAYPVFIITSVLSAAFDMTFVMIQRYNRQRITHLQTKSFNKSEK